MVEGYAMGEHLGACDTFVGALRMLGSLVWHGKDGIRGSMFVRGVPVGIVK